MAELGWVYFSKEHKKAAGTIIQLMSQEGMVDELGIGAIRDAFANRLFPGVSTIQTRAKYFFIVPYILLEYQTKVIRKETTKQASKYLEDVEQRIKAELTEKYKAQDAEKRGSTGVIGITLPKNKPIVRRPSSIYWSGIGAFKLMNTKGLGVDAFLASTNINTKYNVFGDLVSGDDTSDDTDNNYENAMQLHSSIAELMPQKDWRTSLSIELTTAEADLLKQLILKYQPDTLLSFILKNEKAQKLMNEDWCVSFADFAKVAQQLNMPVELLNDIQLAHDFSEVMCGSNIAYNYLLREQKVIDNPFKDNFDEWRENLIPSLTLNTSFKIEDVLYSDFAKSTKEHTKTFIANWWTFANSNNDVAETENLIVGQEYFNKKAKARLKNKRLEDVIEKGAIGLGRLNYRFTQAKRIINDILNPKDQ